MLIVGLVVAALAAENLCHVVGLHIAEDAAEDQQAY